MASASNHILPLALNEIPTNFQSGITALKWPEDPKKPAVINK